LREALLWAGVLPVAAFLPFHIEMRFFAPAFPVVLIWIAAGLWRVGAWMAETLHHWRNGDGESAGRLPAVPALGSLETGQVLAVVALVTLVLGYWGWTHAQVIQQGRGDLNYAHRQVALWMRDHLPAEAAIMSRDLAISLYAERGFVASPRADYAAYLDYARRKGASYLVVDENELRVLRPYLVALLNDANPPPELEPVYSAADQRGRTLVYRIKD
jgi:hypothetical protein